MFREQERITTSNSLRFLVHITCVEGLLPVQAILNHSTTLVPLVVLIKCIAYVTSAVKHNTKNSIQKFILAFVLMLVVILLSWEREGMNSLCLHWQEHSRFYGCLLSMGSLTALCSRDPWEMLYYSCCFATLCSGQMAGERETENERVREPVSDPCMPHAPFPCAEELCVSYRSS